MLVTSTDKLISRNVVNVSASSQLIGDSEVRNGLNVSNDAAGAAVYLLLGTGTASPTNFDISLAAGSNWPGTVGGAVWRGPVQAYSAGSYISVVEV